MFQGDVTLALAGYNAGENAVRALPAASRPTRRPAPTCEKIQGLLGGGVLRTCGQLAASTRAVFYSPAPLAAAAKAPRARSSCRRAPRSTTAGTTTEGVLHVAHTPPPEGVVYAMIRALD